jgi:hypothetical protein
VLKCANNEGRRRKKIEGASKLDEEAKVNADEEVADERMRKKTPSRIRFS